MKILFIVAALVGGLLLALVGAYCYVSWSFGEAVQRVKLADKDWEKWKALYEIAGQLSQQIASSPNQVAADYSGFGFPKREQDLRDLRTSIGFFNLKFGRLPATLAELAEYESKASPSLTKLANLAHWTRDCRLAKLQRNSYFISCDDWSNAEPRDLDTLARSFNSHIEKFYLVNGRLLLFVPNK